jgi:hypothetical protein
MTSTPQYIADLFGLEPEPEAAPPSAETVAAAEAAEAALAAELEAVIASGGVAGDAPDSRTDLRVPVAWPARLRLPAGRVIALEVRNVSEGGVGLASGERIPADTIVSLEMDVPSLDAGGAATPVAGTIRTTYTAVQGAELVCGGTWQAPPAGLALVTGWIARLRR